MSTQVINTCDKCKEVIEPGEQVWDVGLVTKCREYHQKASRLNTANMYLGPDHKIEVCRQCLKALGIISYLKDEPEVEKTPPTLEERIEEMVQIYLEEYQQ